MAPTAFQKPVEHPFSRRLSITEDMKLLGMKPILISAALLLILLLVVSEVSSAPVVDTVSSSTAVETLNSPLNRNAASCHSFCYWNPKRGLCWYRPRGRNGRGECLH